MSPLPLTDAQAAMLVYIAVIGPKGHDAAPGHSVLRALHRRGLASFGGTRALPHIAAWHVTPAGRDWLRARRLADAATPR